MYKEFSFEVLRPRYEPVVDKLVRNYGKGLTQASRGMIDKEALRQELEISLWSIGEFLRMVKETADKIEGRHPAKASVITCSRFSKKKIRQGRRGILTRTKMSRLDPARYIEKGLEARAQELIREHLSVKRSTADYEMVSLDAPRLNEAGTEFFIGDFIPDSFDVAEEACERVSFQQMLEKLPQKAAAAVELRAAGFKQEEIAAQIGTSQSRVSAYLSDARNRILKESAMTLR